MEKIFSETDLKYIVERGNSLDNIMQQLHYFNNGISKTNLVKSAQIGDGILHFKEEEKNQWANYFDTHKEKYSIEKFIPASGAATRMFQFLSEFLERFNPDTNTITSYTNKYNDKNIQMFIVGIRNFPFHTILKEKTKELFPNYASYNADRKVHAIITTLLAKNGLNYANKPKGILPFHYKNSKNTTPIEEHILESEFFKKDNHKSKLHFTVSPEFKKDFEFILNQFESIDYKLSFQDQTTDTIAVNSDNTPFRLENGNLFFRPGGHGALIYNLNQVQSEIVFIKNIDNVAINDTETVIKNKKVLGGVLIYHQQIIFDYIKQLTAEKTEEVLIQKIIHYVEKELCFPLSEEFYMFQKQYQIEYLIKILNRPIRVCGMVKNEGEPGGGPFWVKDEKGRITLQIVESSQIDTGNYFQKAILENATHFNPVDLVCGLYNYKGEKFDLTQFIDHSAAFITEKSKLGKPIKAFELPGLWNGAMAKWTTLFVEVPLETFNPVKTVNDLLKPAHQAYHE